MARPSFATVDDYLSAMPEASRGVLQRVRKAILKALPQAREGISYRIPVYKIDGRMVLYFAGFKEHYSVYPLTDALIAQLGAEVKERQHSKGTIRFSYDEAVPTALIGRIAKVRAGEVANLVLLNAKKKQAAKKRTGPKRIDPKPTGPKRRSRKGPIAR